MKRFRDTEYFVTEEGNVFRNEKQLKPSKDNGGYLGVQVCKNGVVKRFLIHRMVGECYLDNVNNLPEINHEDGNKSNNRYCNLKWTTSSDNKKHAYNNGLMTAPKGEKSKVSKLKNEDVIYIREKYKPRDKQYNKEKLSTMFNVSQRTINDIISKKTWKHI
jgi:hypothetical protein